MNKLKKIRWQQRFSNLLKACEQLEKGARIQTPSDIEIQGIIQSFEFTFELSWKTLKDFLESQGVAADFPREVLKQAFHYGILADGEIWLQMLSKRNLLAHTYEEKLAKEAYELITRDYLVEVRKLVSWLSERIDE